MRDYYELLNNHFTIQKGMYFSDQLECDGWNIFLSDIITDGYWNYAVKKKDGTGLYDIIEDEFVRYKRSLSIYTIDSADTQLLNDGFDMISQESFMLYDGKANLPYDCSSLRRALKGSKSMEDFINVFMEAYGGEKTPEQPYGGLDKSYINALTRSFDKDEQFQHFVYYNEKEPVSIASLCMKNGLGGIYNVGTIPTARECGFGTFITMACIDEWIRNEGNILMLQTEQGSTVEKWYNSLGFETVFIGRIYSKG